MSSRGWSIAKVVASGRGGPCRSSSGSRVRSSAPVHGVAAESDGVIVSRVLLAVLVWGVPVVVAWRQLGRQAAGMTGAIMGAGLVSGWRW